MERKAEVALVQTALAAILKGTSFPVTSLGLKTGLDPRTFVFLRFAIAAPLMLATSRLMGRNVVPLLRSRPIWVVGLLNATGFFCQHVGKQYTRASAAALLINLSVIFAAGGSALFLKEGFGGLKVAGVTLAIVGTGLVTTNGNLAVVGGNQLLGEGLYLMGAATWGGYIVYCGLSPPLRFAGWLGRSRGGGAYPGHNLHRGPEYCGTFHPISARPQVSDRNSLAVILMLEIVVAMIASVAFLGEALTLSAWAGAAAVLVSIALVSRVGASGKSLTVQQTDVGPAG